MMNKHLNDEQINQLNQLLIKFQNTFSKDDMDIGHFTRIEHRIDTRDALPTKEGIRTPLGIEKEEEEHLKDLLKKGIIQPSSSEWAAASVIRRKKDGKIRYCIDYRKLNSVSRRDAFPLPRRIMYRSVKRNQVHVLSRHVVRILSVSNSQGRPLQDCICHKI